MYLNWRRWFGIANCVAFSIWGNSTNAQITPDTNLPENSRVTINNNIINIEGGTKSGSNLFHSFSEFSVHNGSTAYFNNAQNIQNIIGRVTGKSISNIDGLIQANGAANLFLINPNGIVFGKNARLEIGGSFFATTANSVKFADGFEYSTTAQKTPLLTISTPIGLQFGANPGLIQVQGNGEGIRSRISPSLAEDTNVALRVKPNQTLALVGGDISLEGATLKTAGGRIELGSVASNSLVSLIPTEKGFSLDYGGLQNFGNIRLSQQTAVDATGVGGGDVQITARSLKLSDGSVIETSTLGSKSGGNLTVNSLDEVQLSGEYNSPDKTSPTGFTKFAGGFYAQAEENATGAAGDITINTRLLQVQDGAQVSAVTKGAGRVGNLTVKADTVELSGNSSSVTGLGIQDRGSTNAIAELKINTRVLRLENGSFVSTDTFGSGNGANLTVNATDSVQLKTGSVLSSQIRKDATGFAGNLTINTPLLRLEDGSFISASTFGDGRGGNLTVNTNGGVVELTGTAPDGYPTNMSTLTSGKGFAGTLTINTRTLRLDNGAKVSVNSTDQGQAGTLTVTAKDIRLDQGTISADTTAGQGNIKLVSGDLILRHGSNITTKATGSNVNAGNINIDTDVLAAIEKSNIIANSADARGGLVIINTQGLFLSPDSTITATGANPQLNGIVQINTPDIDPSRGLVQLPTTTENTPRFVASSCAAFDSGGSSFTITGRGGLPPGPTEPLTNDVVWTDARLPVVKQPSANKPKAKPHTKPKAEPIAIVPATGWVFNKEKGEVTLISNADRTNNLGTTPSTCPAK